MSLDPNALDRHITGNWGEDQFPDEADPCEGDHDLVYMGVDQGYDVYTCRNCGDIFDRRDKR